jgi:hypothetical protein
LRFTDSKAPFLGIAKAVTRPLIAPGPKFRLGIKSITAVNPCGTVGIGPAAAPFFWAFNNTEVQHTDRHINPLTILLLATSDNTRIPKIRMPQTYKKSPDFPPNSTAS